MKAAGKLGDEDLYAEAGGCGGGTKVEGPYAVAGKRRNRERGGQGHVESTEEERGVDTDTWRAPRKREGSIYYLPPLLQYAKCILSIYCHLSSETLLKV